MSYLDPPDRQESRSRHRARHADVAAPEAYPEPEAAPPYQPAAAYPEPAAAYPEPEAAHPYPDDSTALIPVYPPVPPDDLDLDLDGGRTARPREERAGEAPSGPPSIAGSPH